MNENKQVLRYDVTLAAPIGDKKGELTVNIANDVIEGELLVMNSRNYFCGSIGVDGSCEISGNIKTLNADLEYSGSGYLNAETVTLILNTGNRKLLVTGKRSNEGGKNT